MQIDVLSNCASVLRADPYSLDNDALAESIEVSRAAGFDAVGLWGFHVMFGGDDAAQVVTNSGMPVQTIDAALGWVAGASDEATAEIDGLIALADQLGASVIHATTLAPEVDLAAAAEGYAQIAAQAEAAGKVLGLEFLPWTASRPSLSPTSSARRLGRLLAFSSTHGTGSASPAATSTSCAHFRPIGSRVSN